MSVELEFKWPLDNGTQVIVIAGGYFHREDNGIWPVELGFNTDLDTVGNAHETLAQITKEMPMIEAHAVAMLIDKAQEEIKEAS